MMQSRQDAAPFDLAKGMRDLITSKNRVRASGPRRDSPDVPLVVPADERCPYHCIAAAQNVALCEDLPLESKIERAKAMEQNFILYLRALGKDEIADRLSLNGKEGRCGLDEMELLAGFLGGPIHMKIAAGDDQVEVPEPVRYGDNDRPLMLMLSCDSVDGAGAKHEHYNLLQSWIPISPLESPPQISDALRSLGERFLLSQKIIAQRQHSK